ncbi:hypothetical protein J4206_06860 [Candidatus Woesearchaeota archaeon]|nr:hypothetical protein [Candidatus Woesearchaeota archaeon]
MAAKHMIYAFENLDGACAAAILVRWMRIKQFDYKVDFLSYSNVEQEFSQLSEQKQQLIFILDFPPEQVDRLEKKFATILQNNSKIIYWNTHLKCSQEIHDLLAKNIKFLDFDTTKCAAIMCWQRFMLHDKISQELSAIAFDHEFWVKKDERSAKLADILVSGYNKKDLVEELSKGIFWSEKFEKLREEYLVKKEKAFAELINNLQTHYYGRYNFAFGFSSSLLSTADAGSRILENKGIDVSVVIYRDGKISFRRNEQVDINLVELARLFNGGGHEFAAGGKISDVTLPIASHDKFKIAVEHVDKIMREKLR